MSFEDLFLAAFAVGLGIGSAKIFFGMFDDWLNASEQNRKKFWYILEGIFLFAFLLYFSCLLSSRQLF